MSSRKNNLRTLILDVCTNYYDSLEREQEEYNRHMSTKPLEEQLEYYFDDKCWQLLETSPPDHDEVVMYANATRLPGRSMYEVPQLPCHRLELLLVEDEVFIFSVFAK